MALYDNVFVAESVRNISHIFGAKVPSGKRSLQLKMKRKVLDIPVFREPGRTADGYRTSPTQPLRSGTWLRYLRRLGRNSGLEQSFTQYCARRGLVNAVNSKSAFLSTPSSSFDDADTNTRDYRRQSAIIRPGPDIRSPVQRGSILP